MPPLDEYPFDEDAESAKPAGPNPFESATPPDMKKILVEQGREVPEPELDVADYPEISFQLANGHEVYVSVKPFLPYFDFGVNRAQFYSIKIFSNDGMVMGEVVEHYEFRIERENSLAVIPALWTWMTDLIATPRRVDEYDEVDEFIEEMADQIHLLPAAGEDVVDHLSHFPESEGTDVLGDDDDETS